MHVVWFCFVFLDLFILCYADSLYIFHFPNGLHHSHPSINSIYMCAAQSDVIVVLAKENSEEFGAG